MSENNSEPPDSPSYVQDAEASQIIRDTLDNYEAELKAHSKESPSSIVRSGSGSFVFTTACPKVTPSSTIRENAHSQQNTLTPVAKRGINNDEKYSDSDSDSGESVTPYHLQTMQQKTKKRKNRRKDAAAVSSLSSTHYDKKMKTEDDSICIKQKMNKPRRTKVSVAIDRTKQQRLPNEIRVSTNNSVTTSPFHVNPNGTTADYELCLHCKSRKYMCHNVRYRKYCLQAAHIYLHTNNHGWLAGFSPARMESVFASAYNKIRKVDINQMFGYYHSGYIRVPKCMELHSMQEAVDLGFTPSLGTMLEEENAQGKEAYFRAQRDNNC